MEDKQKSVTASALVVRVDQIARKAREREAERARKRLQETHLDFSEPRSSANSR